MTEYKPQSDSVKLRISNMTKRYHNGDGVSDIDLDVREGEIVTLLGPSGCGKSTILRTIGGFIGVDKGEILIDGKPVQHLPPEKRPTAMVFQSYNLWPHMTIYDNLAFGLQIKKMPKKEIAARIDKMLRLVHMEGHEKKYPTQLSGGQQQRVAIARALLLEPSVLLLDEPFSALDAKIRAQMREELKRIQQELKITVVFVTHDQEEAMALSDRIVVMNKGVIEQVGGPTEIYDCPKTRYVASFIGEMNFLPGENGTEIAVRPEDVWLDDAMEPELSAVVRTIMPLGHYTKVGLEAGEHFLRAYVPKTDAASLRVNDTVSLTFHKKYVYNQDGGLMQ